MPARIAATPAKTTMLKTNGQDGIRPPAAIMERNIQTLLKDLKINSVNNKRFTLSMFQGILVQ